jgi:hypothetical protein
MTTQHNNAIKYGITISDAELLGGTVMRYIAVALLVFGITSVTIDKVLAWGDEGHEIVGLIADKFLDDSVRAKVNAMLATDTSKLTTGKDIGSEATWADKYRDENQRKDHYEQTQNWHFVDIEILAPN